MADGNAVVVSAEDENRNLASGEPRKISHVDDVSDRTVAEHALTAKITCSRHGSMAAWSSMFSKSCPKKGQLPTSVTGRRTRQRDAARTVLGVLFKNRKRIPGFVAKQHCEIVCRAVIADDLVTHTVYDGDTWSLWTTQNDMEHYSCRAHVASDASLTLCLCQKDQDSSLLAWSRSLGPFQ